MRPYKIFNIVLVVVVAIVCLLHVYADVSLWWLTLVLALHLSIFFYGVVNIRANFFLKSHYRNNHTKLIALTFDDGPAAHTEQILDILSQHQVPATFFAIGKNIAKQTDTVKRWHKEGHITGNHSYYHGFNFDWQSSNNMAAEIELTNQAIANIVGKKPKLFRPPYGITNPNVARAVSKSGVLSIAWTLRSFDTKAKDPEKLLADIFNKLKGGDIILMHDSMEITTKILTPLIVRSKEMGYTFVPVNELLEIEPYEKP